MTAVHVVLGVAAVALCAFAALVGGWRWWRAEPSRLFWRLLRGAQAALVLDAALGGALLLWGERPGDDLHYVYGLTPLLVSFAGEGLRIGSAETVLEARGLASTEEVHSLPPERQRSIVAQVMRREMGVMALAAAVMFGLAVRAAFA